MGCSQKSRFTAMYNTIGVSQELAGLAKLLQQYEPGPSSQEGRIYTNASNQLEHLEQDVCGPTAHASRELAQRSLSYCTRVQSRAAGTSPLVDHLQQVQAAVGLGAPARANAGLARRRSEGHAALGLQQRP